MIPRRLLAAVLAATLIAVLNPSALTAQGASLVGTVLRDSSERPLSNAEVTLPALGRSTRSDSAGVFQFTGLKAGTYEVVVRMVGYEPISATLRFTAAQRVEGDFLLRPSPPRLAAIEVTEKASLYGMRLAEFDARRKFAIGRYLTADVFQQASGRQLNDIITSKMPGTRSMRLAGVDDVMATTRGNGLRPGPCPMQVVVNGLVMYRAGMMPFSLRDIQTDNVIGLEFYTLSTTPMEYAAGGGCGTLVIWTK